MRILHWALIFIIIVFPFSIVARNMVNVRLSALKDEVRINNAIDTATTDAVDQIISANGFLNKGYEYDEEFGDIIDVTPNLAQEAINTFFHTMAVNYNVPYQMKDTVSVNERNNSYIQEYFSPYVPVIVVVAYDGFYYYSQELTHHGSETGYEYKLSSKIPYSFKVNDRYTIGYTLGRDVYLYINNGNYAGIYSGRLNYHDYSSLRTAYNTLKSSIDFDGDGKVAFSDISFVTQDLSIIIYAMMEDKVNRGGALDSLDQKMLSFLQPSNVSSIDFLQDYTKSPTGQISVGEFHKNRRKVITDTISACLTQEINEHNIFANTVGLSYQFVIPEISEDDWINSINDISVLSFIQGLPLGTAKGIFFNSFALGGSQIVEKQGFYCENRTDTGSYKGLYHRRLDCPAMLRKDDPEPENRYNFFVINRDDAYEAGYVACQECN